MRDTPKTEAALLGRLVDLFDEEGATTPDEIDAELRAAGIDPAELRASTDALVEAAVKASPFNWRHRAASERAAAERAFSQSSVPTKAPRSEIVAEIRKILDRLPALGSRSLVQVHCRNFDKSTDEDLAGLLVELRFLEARQRGPDSGR